MKNREFIVECEDLSDMGYGVAHIDGKTIFVRDLLPKEKAKIKIIKDLSKYSIAIVSERFNDSPERVAPFCSKNGQCGGCSFWNLNYESQMDRLHKQMKTLIHRVDPEIEVLPVIDNPNPYFYRNKAQFPVAVKGDEIVAGFYRPHSHEIVDIDLCRIQDEKINEIFSWIKQNLPVKSARGLRHLFIRHSGKTGQSQVVFIGPENIGLKEFTKKLIRQFPEIVSVVYNENKGKDNVILGDKYEVLEGSDSILEDCDGLKIRLHFKSFFQVNPEQMEKLYGKAMEFADLQGNENVIDLYSGTGTIGMLAARKAGKVTGVEIVEEAVRNANENAKLNGITNFESICMDAGKFASTIQEKVDVLFVDPPRKGLSQEAIDHIVRIHPEKLVYISCGPNTLARDLKIFREKGYETLKVQPVDMFSHTGNVENVALLVPETKPEKLVKEDEKSV